MVFTCDGTKNSNSHIDKMNLFPPLILALANYKLGITAREAPEPLHRARGQSGTDSTFLHTPLRRLSARRRGESAMLPSVGAEHGVSGELQAGNPSGRPCPIR
jgi:hypothetical protein